MLDIKNLSIALLGKTILDSVSLKINKGSVSSIIGENAAGKTLLLKSIFGLLSEKFKVTGSVKFLDEEIMGKSSLIKSLLKSQVSYIFQDSFHSLNPTMTIERQIFEVIGKKNTLNIKRACDVLNVVGINDLSILKSLPHELSGGQCQRIAIAIAIASNPKLLIADEPTSELDSVNCKEILKIFKFLKSKGISILLVSHDIKFIKDLSCLGSDLVYVIKNGKVTEEGEAKKTLFYPKTKYLKTIIENQNIKPFSFEAKENKKQILRVHKVSVKLLKSNSLLSRFLNRQKIILNKISFELNIGENIAILGESGSGKTTIALTLMGFLKPFEGEIFYENDSNSKLISQQCLLKNKLKLDNLKKNSEQNLENALKLGDIQMIFQNPLSSFNPLFTIKKIILEGVLISQKIHKNKTTSSIKNNENLQSLTKVLKMLNLDTQILNRYPNECSGGELRKISLARSLMMNPKILILDEPTSSLDIIAKNDLAEDLKLIQLRRDITYIIMTHDVDFALGMSDKIITLKNGKIV